MNRHYARGAAITPHERQVVVPALFVTIVWQMTVVTAAWAQATIDVPPLSDWLDTVAWYGLVPVLRILGAAVFVAGLVSLRSSGHSGSSGLGLVAMVAGGILLLVPEIVNAIYTKTTVGASWATSPGGGAAGP